uniref:(California timema) hypothetical protein n=1 Tax=Timema californicum TaxID=61474 RepID=A0A7R9J8V5_TIMCA|nr:unnamed protein product [Timema californicum]
MDEVRSVTPSPDNIFHLSRSPFSSITEDFGGASPLSSNPTNTPAICDLFPVLTMNARKGNNPNKIMLGMLKVSVAPCPWYHLREFHYLGATQPCHPDSAIPGTRVGCLVRFCVDTGGGLRKGSAFFFFMADVRVYLESYSALIVSLTGKSITTSVPTFAIRFRADDEELEAVYPSPDETDEESEKQAVEHMRCHMHMHWLDMVGFESLMSNISGRANEVEMNLNFSRTAHADDDPPRWRSWLTRLSSSTAEDGEIEVRISVVVNWGWFFLNGFPLSLHANADDELGSSSQVITVSPMAASSASTTVPGVAHSRDPSPMKEYLKGLGKRSTSVDAGVLDPNTSGSDTWRIFHELKGKITKTVEEKLTEMKNERKSSSSGTFLGGSALRGGRMMGGGGSKDDSSISDSESVSESSSKGQEPKSSSLKESDGSPKKVVSNQEDKVIEEDIASSTNSLDLLEVSDTPTLIYSLGSKSSSHTKIKHFQGLRRRKVPKASSNPSSPTSVKMSLLARSDQELEELDVEPGVEAYEDSDIVTPLDTNLDYDIPTTDFRTSPPSSNDVVGALSRPRRRSFFSRYKVAQKLLILVAILATYFLFQLPTYLSGFLCGVLMTVASYTLFLRLCDILKPTPSMLLDVDVASERFAVPDYSKMPILEIPAAKDVTGGWMNEYPFNYEPGRYSLTDTRSVYVRLEGSTMRISQTRAKIPKRAMFNEREHNKVKFHHQRIYDISQCRVALLPEGLTRKRGKRVVELCDLGPRLWSKKYPICIMFDKNCVYKVEFIKEDSTQDIPDSSQDLQDPSSDKGGLVELAGEAGLEMKLSWQELGYTRWYSLIVTMLEFMR